MEDMKMPRFSKSRVNELVKAVVRLRNAFALSRSKVEPMCLNKRVLERNYEHMNHIHKKKKGRS